MSQTDILYVSSAPENSFLAELSSGECSVRTVTSIDEVKQILARPNLPVMVIDGTPLALEFCDSLKETRPDCLASLIALVSDSRVKARLLENGVNPGLMLSPPFDAATLRSRLSACLDAGRLRMELAAYALDLEKNNDRMSHLLGMKDRFLSLATHDLRTPLTTMKLVGEMIEKQLVESSPPGIKRMLDILARNIAKIEVKVDELLLIARMDMEVSPLELQEINVNEIALDVIKIFFPGAISRGVELDAVFGGVARIQADARCLDQLMCELIASSLERLDTGDHVEVRISTEGEGVRISVTDDGPPMREGQAEQLMEGLLNESPTRQTRVSLYTAHVIAQRHGGRLEITSSESKGTTFSVWMPQQAATGESA